MWDQATAPMRVRNHAQLGDGLFQFAEPESALSPLEVRMIRLELRIAALEARTVPARWHRLVLWVQHHLRRLREASQRQGQQARTAGRQVWRRYFP